MQATDDLVRLVTQHINVQQFYKGYFPEWNGRFNTKVRCPFHNDKDPSFQIYDDGHYHCFGCGAHGGGPIHFEHKIKGITFGEALRGLYGQNIGKPVELEVVQMQRDNLLDHPDLVERLQRERGWTKEVMGALALGFTKEMMKGKEVIRLTVPVTNAYGITDCIYYHDVFGMIEGKGRKTVEMQSGMNTAQLWPVKVLEDTEKIVLCEGVSDVITAFCHEIPAVTVGAAGWKIKSEDVRRLAGKDVYICYDMDEAGRAGALQLMERLVRSGLPSSVRDVCLPMEDERHTDLTDWLHHEGHTVEDFWTIAENSKRSSEDAPTVVSLRSIAEGAEGISPSPSSSPPFVPLRTIHSSERFKTLWQTEAVVIGRSAQPLIAPRSILLQCRSVTPKCIKRGICPFALADRNRMEVTVAPWEEGAEDQYILTLTEGTQNQKLNALKDFMGIPKGCSLRMTTQKTYTVHKVLVAPPVTFEAAEDTMDMPQVLAYYYGDNVRCNVPYLFTGYTVEHPRSSVVTAVLIDAKSTATTLDAFKVTTEKVNELSAFRIPVDDDLFERLMEYYQHCARSLSGIVGRDLLHMGADLVFHSPVSFFFAKEFVRKGPLDVILFGDPRTGKNYVVDSFQRYYQHGETLSGECITPMNLIGGIKTLSEFRGLQWGRLVARHRDTVIIDEMSALSTEHIGLLSRIRSEGIANVDKEGHHQSADAICGILWLSNPRDHRLLGEYTYGIKALQSLSPGPEDIARYDYAIAVAIDDVPAGDINKVNRIQEEHRFTQEQCHDLILWSKSRSPAQIKFSDEATSYIMEEACALGKKYTSKIPLVLSTNMRFKLAKIAAAIAAKTFSSDTSGEFMYVTKRHAECAVRFIQEIYATDTIGYELFSEVSKRFEHLDEETLEGKLKRYADLADIEYRHFCVLMMKHDQMSIDDMQSILSLDRSEATALRNLLVRYHCIARKGNWYSKARGFNSYLRKVVRRKECDPS